MFSSYPTWAVAQVQQESIPDTITVNLNTVIDWSTYGLTVLLGGTFLMAALYAIDLWLDERQADAHESRTSVEWSRLTRTIRAAHRDLGGAR